MALVASKTTDITNLDASPAVKSSTLTSGGRLRESIGVIEIDSTDDIESTYQMVRLPSHARISTIEMASDDLGTTGDLNLGLMETDGTMIDEDFFALAVDVNAAAVVFTDYTYSATPTNIANAANQLWQNAGASSDPGGFYDIVVRLDEASTATGTVAVRVRYTDGT